MPRLRVKARDLAAAGVERVGRTVGVRDGRPVLDDGRMLDVATVVWCTGFHPGFSWIDLPVFGEDGPVHERGVVGAEPGLYFVGLPFLYAASSAMIHGVGRDAERIAGAIAARPAEACRPGLQPAESDASGVVPGTLEPSSGVLNGLSGTTSGGA